MGMTGQGVESTTGADEIAAMAETTDPSGHRAEAAANERETARSTASTVIDDPWLVV
jgi:hypothetical protein